MKKGIIIGAGAAGIGFGVALKELGYDDFLILESETIGNSFKNWPQETRFITPSFTSNGFGMPDLNAVSFSTSPAYSLGKERLAGKEYAQYLELVAKGYELPLLEHQKVNEIKKEDNKYQVYTDSKSFEAKYIIFAVGQYSTPDKSFGNIGIHYSEVQSWKQFTNEKQIVIGGNESGIDAALNLAKNGNKVNVYTQKSGLSAPDADPSIRLSTYTRQKFFALNANQRQNIKIHEKMELKRLTQQKNKYLLEFANGHLIEAKTEPILCTGFKNGAVKLQQNLFEEEEGTVLLNDYDESLKAQNIFLVGPDVRHQNAIFCYIYKFRQRFAVIIEEIAKRENLQIDKEKIAEYQKNSFYLANCNNCVVACDC